MNDDADFERRYPVRSEWSRWLLTMSAICVFGGIVELIVARLTLDSFLIQAAICLSLVGVALGTLALFFRLTPPSP